MRNLLLPFLCCLLLSCGTIQQKIDHKKIATKSCNNLYPISQPEDFVKQAYANLNSDCLFEMSAKDLQASWKIPVLTWQNFEELKNLETIYRQQSDVPYYVLMNKNTMKLDASDDFLVKNGSLLIKKIDSLPKPNKVIQHSDWSADYIAVLDREHELILKKNNKITLWDSVFKHIAKESDFTRATRFYWFDDNLNQPKIPNMYIHTDMKSRITFIVLNRDCYEHCRYLTK